MNKSNTVEKGDKLEDQVYNIVKKLLANDEFYLPGKRSRPFLKKAYKSVLTGNDIVIDVAIETYMPDMDTYSLLTVIECKNYEKNIPVEKIRIFSDVINQIGAHKGIIMSRKGFAKGIKDEAKPKKIGLCVINENDELDWINTRLDKKHQQYDTDKINSFLLNDLKTNFFGYFNNKSYENLPNLLIDIGVIDRFENKQEFIKIPYKTEQQINDEITKIADNVYIDDKLDSDKLVEFIKNKYKVKFVFDQSLKTYDKHKILGKINFKHNEISITKELQEENHRWRFTLAHEIGHLILHSRLLENFIESNIDNENTILHYNTSNKVNVRMEIQANMFASLLLLPERPLRKIVRDYFIEIRNYKGRLHLDNQPINRQLTYALLGKIKEKLGVSNDVGKYRLISLNLLEDKTDNSIKQIILNI
jgi:Zn-dependent peptidase ImmA (M78 family)